jgi:thioredoxin reductase (NADPH)
VLNKVYPICVIGGGASGVMAVLRSVLNNDECLFFPGTPLNKKRSRAMWVRKVENIPHYFHYKKGIEDPNKETIKWIENSHFSHLLQIKKNQGVVKLEKRSEDLFEITDSSKNTYFAKFVVLCTGVMDIQPIIQGKISPIFDYANAQTVDYCLICDGHHVLNKRLAVIGHSNTAAWVAVMLSERYGPKTISLLTHGKELEADDQVHALIKKYEIEIIDSEIVDILGENKGEVLKAFVLENKRSVAVDIAFVSLGMIVYNQLALQVGAKVDDRGFVIASDQGETSVSGLFVAGDIKANTKKQIYTAWDTAVNAINSINQKIRSEKRKNH